MSMNVPVAGWRYMLLLLRRQRLLKVIMFSICFLLYLFLIAPYHNVVNSLISGMVLTVYFDFIDSIVVLCI